jgi:hypothetical protein
MLRVLQPGAWKEHITISNFSFVNSMLFLMRNCFAHFREVNNGLEAFGTNTTV